MASLQNSRGGTGRVCQYQPPTGEDEGRGENHRGYSLRTVPREFTAAPVSPAPLAFPSTRGLG